MHILWYQAIVVVVSVICIFADEKNGRNSPSKINNRINSKILESFRRMYAENFKYTPYLSLLSVCHYAIKYKIITFHLHVLYQFL